MMKFKHIFMVLFFAVLFQILGAQAVLSPEVLNKINGAVFEVVVLKPEEGKVEYEKKLPMDRIPFAIRNDKYIPIGTAFLMDDGKFYSAAHVFNLYEESFYNDYYLRAVSGAIYKVGSVLSYSVERDFIVFEAENYKHVKGEGLSVLNEFNLNTPTFSVGNALGEGIIIRNGLLTSQTFEERNGEWKWLRFSAAASPGNSGGPLISPDGMVLGIITMKSENENLNYALPFAETKNIAKNIGTVYLPIFYNLPHILEERAFYEYRNEQKLPKKLTELRKSIILDYKNFTLDIIKDLKKKYDFLGSENFIKGEGSTELLYDSWNPSFSLILAREENKRWDLFLPNDIKEYKLPQNGNVIYGKMLGSVMAIVKKPNDIDQKTLITSPKLYMDYILTASRMYRYIAGEKIAISSYGEPSRSESHVDIYGRKWLVNYWELPFADSEVISFALPVPGGIFVITRIDSISSIRNGHNYDYAFLSDYILPSYSGTFGEWKEFFNLPPKTYPIDPIFSSMKFNFDSKNTAIKAGDYDFVISQKDFAADKDTNMDLSLGFFVKDNKPAFDICAVNMYSNSRSDDYTYIRFAKTLRPPKNAPQDFLEAWQQKIDQAAPYNAKPYNQDQYTCYDETIFMGDIKKSDKEKLDKLYYISLELKQQNRLDEIQKLASQIKKNLKISVKNK
ncbi:serine protease [Treponema sp. OMZ 799]|uniref:S1 family peptidase n=1 Tax=Treponema sp. OMZ 799 TaxID=2563668 RepID=UPI0020A4EB1A|nr:trypsin-like peptidase domain-containing protein [Treponema sp. OMZ 799]